MHTTPPHQHTATAAYGRKLAIKKWLGRTLYPQQTAAWQHCLQTNPVLCALQDRLSVTLAQTKIYRPYLSRHLTCTDRVQVLQQHYGHLATLPMASLVPAAAAERVLLSEWCCKSGQPAKLFLTAVQDGHREGELCLRLSYQNEDLYACNLVFMADHSGHMHLMVGRLQGVASQDAVRQATRDFHSNRPTNLLVAVVRHMAHVTGCKGVILVSNANRVALNAWRRRKISADYDGTWLDMGAVARSDGNFQLPVLVAPDVDIDGAPQKKRSELRRKLALMETLFADVAQCLSQPRSPSQSGQ